MRPAHNWRKERFETALDYQIITKKQIKLIIEKEI